MAAAITITTTATTATTSNIITITITTTTKLIILESVSGIVVLQSLCPLSAGSCFWCKIFTVFGYLLEIVPSVAQRVFFLIYSYKILKSRDEQKRKRKPGPIIKQNTTDAAENSSPNLINRVFPRLLRIPSCLTPCVPQPCPQARGKC